MGGLSQVTITHVEIRAARWHRKQLLVLRLTQPSELASGSRHVAPLMRRRKIREDAWPVALRDAIPSNDRQTDRHFSNESKSLESQYEELLKKFLALTEIECSQRKNGTLRCSAGPAVATMMAGLNCDLSVRRRSAQSMRFRVRPTQYLNFGVCWRYTFSSLK